ncbi:spore germination protein KC [Paenibacillus glycanilyticus]|uniref:Spore germination protein KC n=1 Tax=Paenibacillus glycanilyticus TaxID=126569 RepID=A0ABQ6NI26_9BACL|nr:Ger(x)C family spore germination protein [Paenibacillus glycanilyticus]GMK44758.1 spore germination protein KC [Paenibacillus glycanilyticus]
MIKRTVTSILLLLLCTGCWDKREITQLALVEMIAFDHDDKGSYSAYFQVLNPTSIQARQVGPAKASVYTYSVKADNFGSILEQLNSTTSRKLFTSHLQIYVVSERAARSGILPFVNYLEMNPERRTNVYAVVSDSTISELMKNFTPLDRVPGRYIRLIIDWHARAHGMVKSPSRIKDIINGIPRSRPTVIPILHFMGKEAGSTSDRLENIDATQQNFNIRDGAVFINARMMGRINSTNCELYNVLNNYANRFFIKIKVHNQNVEIIARNIRIKRKWNKQRRQLLVDVKAELQLVSNEQKNPLTLINQHDIERAFNARFNQLAEDFVALGLRNNWDLLGIGDTSYGRKNWKTIDACFDVQSKVTLAGNTISPYN